MWSSQLEPFTSRISIALGLLGGLGLLGSGGCGGDGHGCPAGTIGSGGVCAAIDSGMSEAGTEADSGMSEAGAEAGLEAGMDGEVAPDAPIEACTPTTLYPDRDGDGFGDPAEPQSACLGAGGLVANADDCDDACASCRPGGAELCDTLDNDCNGVADEPFECTPGTGVSCLTTCGSIGTGSCTDACAAPAGAACAPPAELCNLLDDDCDGVLDEGLGVLGAASVVGLGGAVTDLRLAPTTSGFLLVGLVPNVGIYAQALLPGGGTLGPLLTIAAGAIKRFDLGARNGASFALAFERWDAGRQLFGSVLSVGAGGVSATSPNLIQTQTGVTYLRVAMSNLGILIAYQTLDELWGVRTNLSFGAPAAPVLLRAGLNWITDSFDVAPLSDGTMAFVYDDSSVTGALTLAKLNLTSLMPTSTLSITAPGAPLVKPALERDARGGLLLAYAERGASDTIRLERYTVSGGLVADASFCAGGCPAHDTGLTLAGRSEPVLSFGAEGGRALLAHPALSTSAFIVLDGATRNLTLGTSEFAALAASSSGEVLIAQSGSGVVSVRPFGCP